MDMSMSLDLELELDSQLDPSILGLPDDVEYGFSNTPALLPMPIDVTELSTDQGDIVDVQFESPRTCQLPMRLRRSAIPQTVWDRHRGIIEDLYINQDLKLDELMMTMKQRHGFDATDQMYKRQLRRWNLRKNYSQEQKINIINELSQPRCSGHTRKSTKMLNGRPLKENRLLRSVLKNGKRASLPGQAEIRARRNKQKMSAISHQSRYLQRLQLQQSPEIQKTEDVLKHTQNYYSWYFEQTEVEKEYLYNGDLADAIIQLNLANHILLRQQQCTRAFALLNNCCSTFLGLLRTQPFQLSMQLVVEFTGPNALFRKHRGIWNALVHWFASASNFVLGPQHPITNIILLLTDVGQIESTSFSSRLTQVLDDTVEAVENCEDWNNLQLGLSWILVDFGDLDRASVLCQRLQDRVKPVCGSPTTGQRAVHHLMLRLSIRNKDFTHAEELGLQEVEWTKAATGMPNGNYEGIMACWRMASLYEAMDRCPESLQFHRLAFEGALQPPAECTTSDILDSYDDVARALSRLGRDEELAEFEAQYAYLWEEVMDEWELRPEPQALLDAGNRYLQQLG